MSNYDTLNFLEVKFHILHEDGNNFLKEHIIHDLSQIKCITDISVADQINMALQNHISMMFERINHGEF